MSERAAQIIRDVRARSGLTQRELAGRLRMPSSRIAAYETAAIDPSVSVLDRIVAAAGLDLAVVDRASETPDVRKARLRALASDSVDRSMTIEGKRVAGPRTVAALDEGLLLRRITSHRR
ncbi:helix-turn-helix domain-containing protein [Microbacterium sp. M1A1_1b]